MKISLLKIIGVLLLAAFTASSAFAQMPPHPELKEKIKQGLTPLPFTLKNIEQLREKGVDAPWTSEILKKQSKNKVTSRIFGNAAAPTGNWKTLVILVQFSDKSSQTGSSYFDNLLFATSPGTLYDYYKKISYGTLDIITLNLPSALGWQTAPQTYDYYCNSQNGLGSYPHNSQKLVEDLIQIVDPAVDFSKYDNDGDGFVDALFVLHTGPGAEFTGSNDDIWSHAWSTYYVQNVDGVKVSRYSVEPEYWQTPGDMTIGVFAHELGHAAFGLPDLYDVDYTSEGLGKWSLMAGGSWNGTLGDSPAMPDAYCRIQMGFVTPKIVTSNVTNQAIPDVEDSSVIFKLWKNGIVGSQYFLVENRARLSYDLYLPYRGLLIYHVDESVTTDNMNEWYPGHTSGGHYLVALEQADGRYDLEKNANIGDAGDPYPGISYNQNFSNSTTPDSKDYNFASTYVAVNNISSPSLTMYADFQIMTTDTTLKIVSPNGGENWPEGYTKQIIVDATNSGTFKLEYTTNNGSSWNLIGNVNPSSPKTTPRLDYSDNSAIGPIRVETFTGGIIDWIVPHTPSGQCKVRAISLTKPSLNDESDDVFSIVSVPAGQFDIQFNYDASAVTGTAGNAGAVFISDLNEFWTSRWASGLLHRWTKQGSLIEEFSVSGVTGTRGMTYDGTNIFTANNTSTIYIINPSTKTLVGTITAPLATRYITYDPDADNGNGGFWIGNWYTDLVLIKKNGSIITTLSYANLGSAGNYGAAYDNYSTGGPYIWLSSQDNGQLLTQISIETGLPTGRQHDLLSDIATNGISGGIFVSEGIVNGKSTIGGILQGSPDHLFGYQLTDISQDITVLYPNGSESLKVGENIDISWTSSGINNVKIEYSLNDNSAKSVIAASVSASLGNYQWTIPDEPTDSARIYISNVDNSSLIDSSDNVFRIYAPQPVVVYLDSVRGTANDSVTVTLNVEHFNNVGALALKIQFNSEKLTWGRGVDWNSGLVNPLINAVGDTLSISWTNVNPVSIDSGKAVDLKFFFNGASSPVQLTFLTDFCEISDADANVLNAVYLNGAVIPGFTISGLVVYNNDTNSPLSDVKLYLSGDAADSTISDGNGNYSFADLDNGIYRLNLTCSKVWGGANSTDALIIKRHYVGLDTLRGLELEAGDVNSSGTLNSTDALIIQRRFVGLTNEFDAGDWIFDNPEIEINGSNVERNINGLAVGDVNGSFNAAAPKTSRGIAFSNEGSISANSEDLIDLPVILNEQTILGAVSLIINYPDGKIEIENVKSKLPGLIYKTSNSELAVSWSGINPVEIKSGEELLNIKLKIKNAVKSNENLFLRLDPISELADDNGRIIANHNINIPAVEMSLPGEYWVAQNYPNPFNPLTIIRYDLPEQSNVSIEIFNVLGERIEVLVDKNLSAGSYKVEWNAAGNSSGIYFYRFAAQGKQEYKIIKKMILIK